MQRSTAFFGKSWFLGLPVGLLTSILVLGAAAPASASIEFTLGTPNNALSAYAGPYGTVTVTRINDTTATVTFTAGPDVNGYSFFFGSTDAVDLNVNAASFSVTPDNSSFSYPQNMPSFTDTGSGQVSEFGTFNQTFQNFDGASNRFTAVTLDLTNNSGTWSSDSDVLTPNTHVPPYSVAAHIFVADANGTIVVTGFAADGNGGNITEVPEPASLATWGLLGLVGIGGVIRRRFTRKR